MLYVPVVPWPAPMMSALDDTLTGVNVRRQASRKEPHTSCERAPTMAAAVVSANKRAISAAPAEAQSFGQGVARGGGNAAEI